MQTFTLTVWGDYACFTRPEMKVERVSYDVMTPSAARAVLEAILWKPAITWVVTKIEVLRPIRYTSIRRNEVASVISTRNALTAMKSGSGRLGLYIEEDRQQRAALLLRDVAYRIHARFHMKQDAGENNSPAKFAEMFKRRVEKGQCHYQPYLGCREFSAYFAFDDIAIPIDDSRELGWMLYDMDFSGEIPMPQFFQARMEEGVITLPPLHSQELYA